ncbi:MAG: N-acetylneuraminate synthase [Parcubacteria group bacterium GW2011_GWA2_51_10]|nr:MAG: N-acetylneuraminate synthase [Parcubacteria group bacterium GW2011_GWA2_51_10]
MKTIKIGDREIGDLKPVYVIAEAGVNHNGDIGLAKRLIEAARDSGADAVKFQTFTVDEIAADHAPQARYQIANTGVAESQASMLSKLALSHTAFQQLKKHADGSGVEFLSTPFSIPDADFLHSLDLAAYKIGSGDLTNLPFLEHVAGFEKPILLSTGMATLTEVGEALQTLERSSMHDVVLLQCTSEYPTPLSHVNLRVIETFRSEFDVPIGFSDHTEGTAASVYAASLGACIIEKHFTLSRALPGPDHKASIEPHELKEMITRVRATKLHSLEIPEAALGSAEKKPTAEEVETAKIVRKSIFARRDIRKGALIGLDDVKIVRPEMGLLPKELKKILGMRAAQHIAADTPLSWGMLE